VHFANFRFLWLYFEWSNKPEAAMMTFHEEALHN